MPLTPERRHKLFAASSVKPGGSFSAIVRVVDEITNKPLIHSTILGQPCDFCANIGDPSGCTHTEDLDTELKDYRRVKTLSTIYKACGQTGILMAEMFSSTANTSGALFDRAHYAPIFDAKQSHDATETIEAVYIGIDPASHGSCDFAIVAVGQTIGSPNKYQVWLPGTHASLFFFFNFLRPSTPTTTTVCLRTGHAELRLIKRAVLVANVHDAICIERVPRGETELEDAKDDAFCVLGVERGRKQAVHCNRDDSEEGVNLLLGARFWICSLVDLLAEGAVVGQDEDDEEYLDHVGVHVLQARQDVGVFAAEVHAVLVTNEYDNAVERDVYRVGRVGQREQLVVKAVALLGHCVWMRARVERCCFFFLLGFIRLHTRALTYPNHQWNRSLPCAPSS